MGPDNRTIALLMSPFLPSAPHASRAPRPQPRCGEPGAEQGWGN